MDLRFAPIALLSASAAAAAPQIDDAQALIDSAYPFPDGTTLSLIEEVAMSDQGDWLAIVTSTPGTFETDGWLVHNGAIVIDEGATLPSGEVGGQILGADLATDGTPAWIQKANPGLSGGSDVLFVDGVEELRTPLPISGVGFAAGSQLVLMRGLRFDGDLALIRAEISAGGQQYSALVRVNVGGASPVFRQILREGAMPPGITGPVTSLGSGFDIAADGSFIAAFNYEDSGVTRKAIATDQGLRAVEGGPAPGGNTWLHTSNIYCACAAGSRYVISSDVDDGASGSLGQVVGPNGLLAREGAPFGAIPGETTGFFTSRFVGMSSAGRPAWIAPVGTFDDVLVAEGEARLRETTSTISGSPIGNSIGLGDSYRIAVGSEGREALVVTSDPNGELVLALLELEVGTPDGGCTAVANSTGAIGETRGLGTSIAAANDLVIESTGMPPTQFGLLVTSRTPAFVTNPGGSLGNLCLGGAIGRFNGLIAQADAAGAIRTTVDLTALPQGAGTVAAQAGETWYFQRWHRDVVGGMAASNLTTSVAITFR